jgi:hypothetical protein
MLTLAQLAAAMLTALTVSAAVPDEPGPHNPPGVAQSGGGVAIEAVQPGHLIARTRSPAAPRVPGRAAIARGGLGVLGARLSQVVRVSDDAPLPGQGGVRPSDILTDPI